MPTFVENIASFLPIRVLNCFAAETTPLAAPASGSFEAAVLFVDISGFTVLTERLAQKGAIGVEELTTHLNAYFGQLIELIIAHKGDIVKFAGDAMLAIWPAENLSLDLATYCAAQCALAILNDLGEYQAANAQLRLHIGIGAGELKEFYIGGMNGRWEYFVAGEPIAQVALAETAAGIGEVCLSLTAWESIKDQFVGTLLASNVVRLEGFNLLTCVADRRLLNIGESAPIAIYDEMQERLERYVSVGVLQRLKVGQTDWLGDLRRVSVMFLNLPGMDYGAEGALDFISTIINEIQNILQVYEGILNKFLVDDKGSTLVIGFGLPPFSHEDDSVRCAIAGMALLEKLRSLGLQPKIGITTGTCYSGVIGSQQRREYTIIGAVVNLAARLMQAAKDGILCDERTFEFAKSRIQFESLTPLKLKGIKDAVQVFSPLGEVRQDLPWWMAGKTAKSMVGREKERLLLRHKLEQLKAGVSGVVVICGDAGIGKSCLIENLLSQAQELGVGSLVGAGNAIARSKPYHAWNAVFSHLLDLSFLTDLEAQKSHILDLLEDEPQSLEKAALLNEVLGLDLPDTEVSAALVGQQRAEATRDLLVQLLQDSVNRSPKLLVLEDAHWLDSSSWALVLAVAQNVKPLLLAIGTRPMGEQVPEEYDRLLTIEGVEQLYLEAMPATDTLDLLCRRLGVNSLPDSMAELIEKKAEGNPFFSEELAYGLREAGVIEIQNGECRIAAGVGNLNELNFPATVQGVIASRIDRLSSSEQLTLKVASAIGRSFGFQLLRDIHPIEDDKPELLNYLIKLQRFDLTPMETPEPDLGYMFKHIITQEVAYGLMLYSQRRQVHESLALWYEKSYEELSGFYTILAHHWSKALVAEKAIFYLEKAGEQAVRSHALREAVQLFSEALEWLATLPDTVERKEQELRLHIALGAPLMAIKGFAAKEVEQANARAREICLLLDATPQLFQVLWGQWAFYFFVGTKLQTSREVAEQLLSLSENLQDRDLRLEANYALGSNLFHVARFADAVAKFDAGLSYYDRSSHHSQVAIYGYDKGVACLGIAAQSLWYLGFSDRGLNYVREGLRMAHNLSHPFSLALAMNFSGWLYVLRQEVTAAFEQAQALIMLSTEHEFPAFVALGKIIWGWAVSQRGNLEVGLTSIREGAEAWVATGSQVARLHHLTLLAEVCQKLQRFEEGLIWLSEGLEIVNRTGESFLEAEIYRLKGELLKQQINAKKVKNIEEDSEVERCFIRAIELARNQGSKSLELRSIMSLCRLWTDQGKIEQSRQMLAEIYAWFTEGLDTVDLQEAQTLLKNLSHKIV
ncbi:adenylate/guanylate cyclase domain-containing protein [Microcoleus sp.]|uniref:adenylate/guanylate cyclase domain-containing protein n=1 Tax=Microcoleus sp. TaxID=44472 RepID=UPI00352650A7